ncbi:carbohydrate kinase family protein [Streptomyces melanogenes]|uniref:carbohydrate kinase family protein n=1 Tax=Streptomyces melanogenes TaxID=67326 RepID=UPI00167EA811|nr:carbohydrate kinase [Streptomyces melanogenes]GGP54727.1 ribokinase [Streptomyces melanogenes]
MTAVAPDSARAPVLVIGEALVDILVRADGTRSARPGGSPANAAVGLARLGHRVRLATRVGDDLAGRDILAHLRHSGVELTEGSVVPGPTSTATAHLDAGGAATYDFDIVWEAPEVPVGPFHVHTGSLATALAPGADRVLKSVEAARRAGTVSYDPNIRPMLLGTPAEERPRVERFVALSDVVKASHEDLAWLYPGQDVDGIARAWLESGPSLVVVTLGPDGALARWRDGGCELPAAAVRVTDTVGAGDAFTSGLLSGLLDGGLLGAAPHAGTPRVRLGGRAAADVLASALVGATGAAALTCLREGADPPTRAALERWRRGC